MLGHLRRCPASLHLRIFSPTLATTFRLPSSVLNDEASQLRKNKFQLRKFHKSPFAAQYGAAAKEVEAESHSEERTPERTNEPLTKFKELAEHGLIDRGVIRTLTDTMRLDTMTEVQTRTINEALTGTDVLAQAKTGTGKTIAFLLPIVQNILKADPALSTRPREDPRMRRSRSPIDIKALIISPTRELAEQIAEEARKVTRDTGIVIQTGVGGTQKSLHLRNMHRDGCHILVGTPGRLKDILSDPSSRISAPGLTTLVLDEADRLLDLGFWPEIQEIQHYLPRRSEKDRQTLMFSATVPKEIVQLARSVMKPSLHYVRTVQEDEQPTAQRVTQKLVVVPDMVNQLPAVLELCNRELQAAQAPGSQQRPFKAIVYFNTTMETDLAGMMFFALKRGNYRPEKSNPVGSIDLSRTLINSIHSRLTQAQRTASADGFRRARSGILMSSDVTARGMDFPGVTHVIQVGLPKDPRDTYIHRIGRTARAGQEGEGWLIVSNSEVREVRKVLGDLPLSRDTSLETTVAAFEDEETGGPSMSDSAKQHFWILSDAAAALPPTSFSKAYLAMMSGAANAPDKARYVAQLNRLAKTQWGIDPPGISPALAYKMGLRDVPGLNFRRDYFDSDVEDRGNDRGFQRGGGGRGFQSRDRPRNFGSRGAYQPRSGGRDFEQTSSGYDSPSGRSDRAPFDRGERGFDRDQRGQSQRGGGFDRGGFGGGARGGFGGALRGGFSRGSRDGARSGSRGRSFDEGRREFE